jgi:antitoxin MazE
MQSRIVKIGNSRGVRIPNVLLEERELAKKLRFKLKGPVSLCVQAGHAQTGWHASFKKVADAGEDTLLDGEVHVPTSSEEAEWEW